MRFDRQYRHLYVNPAIATITPHLQPADYVDKTHAELGFPPALCTHWEEMIQAVFDTGQVKDDIFELPSGDNRIIIYRQLIPELNELEEVETVLVTSRDITRQKEAELALKQAHHELEEKVQARTMELATTNAQLKSSLEEKEVLLKEIHHRVKNNLQVISSLFSLQANYTADPQVLEVLQDSQHRVRSMALIHEKLYRSENLARIDFSDYINDLASTLFRTYNAAQKQITLHLNASRLILELEQAIPCGLIVNELISNALKHAFPDGQPGQIQIGLCADEPDCITLIVEDDGVGLPADFDFYQTDSLGLTLVTSLTAQLDGSIDLTQSRGTKFAINFPSKAE